MTLPAPTLHRITPTRTEVRGASTHQLALVAKHLTCTNKSVKHEITRLKKSPWALQSMGVDAFQERIDELTRASKVELLQTDIDGVHTIPSGLTERIRDLLHAQVVDSRPQSDLAKVTLPLVRDLPFKARPYQDAAIRALVASEGPSAVSLGCGLGKSHIVFQCVRHHSVKTVVMTPSVSIARQMHGMFCKHLGKSKVGLFGDGKKESAKAVVIGIDDSLAKVKPGSQEWENLSSSQCVIVDESHLVAAKTLRAVCEGVLAGAAHRHFVSATQMRNDGLDLVLEGIIGPVVYSMTTQEGVDQGYLARPTFRMIPIQMKSGRTTGDAVRLNRQQLLQNPMAAATVGAIVSRMADMGHRVLVMVRDVSQVALLAPRLRHAFGFAHGPLSKDNVDSVPLEHRDTDPQKLVADLDEGRLSILVGTSCISTGTDLRSPTVIVRWKGGASEIEATQDIGRGTRLFPGKTEVSVFDLYPEDGGTLQHHARIRQGIYESLYPSVVQGVA